MLRTSSPVLTSFFLLASLGCAGGLKPSSTNSIALTGNWQFSSASPSAARLSAVSGELSGSGATITGLLHSDSASACVAPSTVIEVRGAADSHNVVTLTGALAGGTLTITGTEASDGKSLTGATYNVAGGSCAFATPADVIALVYTPINGNFAGTFADASGPVISITAALAQTPASDTSGNYQLSGSATFADVSCFSSPLPISNTQVSGGSFTLTYADPQLGNSVTASGTFSADGTTLNVANWSSTGTCGADNGTGALKKQ